MGDRQLEVIEHRQHFLDDAAEAELPIVLALLAAPFAEHFHLEP
jgi:hypothetical protein